MGIGRGVASIAALRAGSEAVMAVPIVRTASHGCRPLTSCVEGARPDIGKTRKILWGVARRRRAGARDRRSDRRLGFKRVDGRHWMLMRRYDALKSSTIPNATKPSATIARSGGPRLASPIVRSVPPRARTRQGRCWIAASIRMAPPAQKTTPRAARPKRPSATTVVRRRRCSDCSSSHRSRSPM
jgi:hypothetical protein